MKTYQKQHFFYRLLQFVKRETVLSVSLLLAAVSACFVRPDAAYLSYIDFRTIGLLFCLMSIVAGLRHIGLFDLLAEKILCRTTRSANLVLLLVGTNIGGLGTLIASMASLISFKYISGENTKLRLPYLGVFTVSNLIFLLGMLGLFFFLTFPLAISA